MAQKRKGKVSSLKKLRETVQQRKARQSLASMNKARKAKAAPPKKKSAVKPKTTDKKKAKAKTKVPSTKKPTLGIERTKTPPPTVKAGDVLRVIGKGASKVAGPLAIAGTGAMLYDYGKKVASEKPKTALDRKKSRDWLGSIRKKTTDLTKRQDMRQKNPNLGKQIINPKPKSKLGQQTHSNVRETVHWNKDKTVTKDANKSSKVANKSSKVATKTRLSRADEDAERIESEGIGLSGTKKSAPQSGNRIKQNGSNPKRSTKTVPSYSTPNLVEHSPKDRSKWNPKGEVYGDRHDDSTMPDMYHTLTKDEYKKGPHDRVIKGFLKSMFGG